MRDQNGMTQADRIVGHVAWWVFWAAIGSICLALKIFYHLPQWLTRFRKVQESPDEAAIQNDLEIHQRTGI